jgi:hypothetical protein
MSSPYPNPASHQKATEILKLQTENLHSRLRSESGCALEMLSKKTTTVEIEPGDVGSATMLEKVYMLC